MFEKSKGGPVKSEEEEKNQKIVQFETYFKNLDPKFN